MIFTLTIAAWLFALLTIAPAGVLFAECLLALRPHRKRFADLAMAPVKTTVLVPAHNESQGIRATIESIRSNSPDVEILVIADNCTDDTAEVAAAAGALVAERSDQANCGKAFALGYGIRWLRNRPPEAVVPEAVVPEAVVVVDADAKVKGDPLSRVAALAVAHQCPIQTLNVIDRSRKNSAMSVVAILGNRLHNIVRPLALQRLGFPCALMGSGMAFPWHVALHVDLENDSLGEDKRLGIDMMLAGYAPKFYLETKVASHIAEDDQSYMGQRTRWEQGHLLVAVWAIPRLIWRSLLQRDAGCLAMAVDLAIPPMAVTAMLWTISMLLSIGCRWIGGSTWPLTVTVAAAAMLGATLVITWLGFARRKVKVSAASLLAVPVYLMRKLPIYCSWIRSGPQRVWLRTERPKPGPLPK
jgi:cellulose synthase/poly-beta-1,6-N-acetylglucosamine synthase-like glycosyltransferase